MKKIYFLLAAICLSNFCLAQLTVNGFANNSTVCSGNSTIIELKYIRNKNGITTAQIKSFQKDIDKIKYLQNLNNPNGNQIYGIFIILNKTSIKTLNFNYFVNQNSEDTDFLIERFSVQKQWGF